MHCTKRRLDRRSAVMFVIVTCSATGVATASCSSADDERPNFDVDASASDVSAPDSSMLGEDGATPRDAGAFDATTRPVECAASACATALVTTTLTENYVDLSEGFCALLHDGTVACWGANGGGQLGRGDDAGTRDSAIPARVVGLSDVVALDHTCAVDKDGAAWCWGTGSFLRSDAVATTTERTPVKLPIPPAKKVAMGEVAACALVDDGVLCWGSNSFAQIAPFTTAPANGVLGPLAIPLPAGPPIRDLVVGKASFVVRDDGTAISWGANPPLARRSPLFPDPYPLATSLVGISAMDLISANACAAVGGIGYCWGVPTQNSGEQSPVERAFPEPVVTPEPIVQISTTGSYFKKPQRWCASAASGAAYCWGYNASGQAGDGTTNYAHKPVNVGGLPAPVVQVKTTTEATCALLTTGKVYCWGTNAYGQLGNGKLRQPSLVPQEVMLP
ncbi:MAG: hypothetical protein K0S65_812 [Labilithrix sp.]|nr:hypothetical protein [Labilithrix sp.]